MRLGLPLLALAAAVAAAAPAHGAELTLSEAKAGGFPDRAFVLTLPEKRDLDPRDVRVTENGERVPGVKVFAGGRSALVLVIDTSESMHGAMDQAMAAAREFAARRRPDQPLGVVFFTREPRVVLAPTTDGTAIAEALAQTPPLTQGTRIYDAAATGVELVDDAAVDSGAVVVFSDGADFGSLTARDEVVEDASAAHARLYTVGLRSPSFDSAELRALAAENGEYAEARSSADLARVFGSLGDRLANEHLIRYRSQAPLATNVAVQVSVAGVDGVATAAYRTPTLAAGAAGAAAQALGESWWTSTSAVVAVVALVALLLGAALALVVRPRRGTLEQRISAFVPRARGSRFAGLPGLPEVAALPVLTSADRWLDRFRPWANFKLDIDVARIQVSAIRLLLATAAGTLGAFALFWLLLDDQLLAVVVLIGIPVAVRSVVAQRANRVRRRFEDQLPDNLQVLASALRAGHSFVGALNIMATDAPEPSRREYRRVVSDEQIGIPVEESLTVVSDRMRCEDVIYIGLIATLQRETGGNTAEVLDKVVETMRERAKIRRLVRTLTVQGRLGGWIVTALPIAMLVFLAMTRPGYMDPMTEETMGIVILVVAGCFVLFGAYAIRRIVDIKV